MTITNLITPLERQTLGTNVYAQLKELLVSGKMVPGEKISLRPTAAALGVSIMPVREAIQRLIAEQALEMLPNRAIRIPIMPVTQFREITKIRKKLEGYATEIATNLLSKAELIEITNLSLDLSKEMEKKKPDGARLVNINKNLHFAIYHGAQMPTLVQLVETLWLRIGPILNYDLHSQYRTTQNFVVIDNHSRLVDALNKKNADLARQALEDDIESAAEYIISAGVLVVND